VWRQQLPPQDGGNELGKTEKGRIDRSGKKKIWGGLRDGHICTKKPGKYPMKRVGHEAGWDKQERQTATGQEDPGGKTEILWKMGTEYGDLGKHKKRKGKGGNARRKFTNVWEQRNQ